MHTSIVAFGYPGKIKLLTTEVVGGGFEVQTNKQIHPVAGGKFNLNPRPSRKKRSRASQEKHFMYYPSRVFAL